MTENESFYQAFGLKAQKAQLEGITTVIVREKEVARVRLQLMSEALVKALLAAIAEQTDAASFEEIKKQIKFERF